MLPAASRPHGLALQVKRGRHEEHGNGGEVRDSALLSTELRAIHHRQMEIEQDDAWLPEREHQQRLASVGR